MQNVKHFDLVQPWQTELGQYIMASLPLQGMAFVFSGRKNYDTCSKLLEYSDQYSFQSVNPFPNKPWFLRICCKCFLKTLWEREKLMVISPFPTAFSTCIENFLPFSSNLSFGKVLTLSQTSLGFYVPAVQVF